MLCQVRDDDKDVEGALQPSASWMAKRGGLSFILEMLWDDCRWSQDNSYECHLSLGSHPLIDACLSFRPQAMAAMANCLTCKDPFSP